MMTKARSTSPQVRNPVIVRHTFTMRRTNKIKHARYPKRTMEDLGRTHRGREADGEMIQDLRQLTSAAEIMHHSHKTQDKYHIEKREQMKKLTSSA